MNPDEYGVALSNYIQSDQFSQADDDTKQDNIKSFREGYLVKNPDVNVDTIDSITQGLNKLFLRGTGRGRVIPKININLPNQEAGYDKLTPEQRATKLEEFKSQIPTIAKDNPAQKDDTEYFLNQELQNFNGRMTVKTMEEFTVQLPHLDKEFLQHLQMVSELKVLPIPFVHSFMRIQSMMESFRSNLPKDLALLSLLLQSWLALLLLLKELAEQP